MIYTGQYDELFKAAYAKHWPDNPIDWRWLKAQCAAESLLNPDALAPDGGMGIAQDMPATWDEICDALGFPMFGEDHRYTAYDPNYAIHGIAWYMRNQWNSWTSKRAVMDHLQIAQASYNAGLENILLAQKAANDALDYADIIAALHEVTGQKNATITIDYVLRTAEHYAAIVSQDSRS